jgi:exodeoxyribonuclease-3
LKITTWNVNSIRARLERVLDWLDRRAPDVLALQETKVVDEAFPREPFEERGYHVEAYGQKTYNGVALVTRPEMREVVRGFGEDPEEQRRLIAAVVEGVRVVCVYVPNGQATDSPKFPYKLGWLRDLRAFLDEHASPEEPVLVVGDFNVAPEDRDVHDPDAWRGKVLFSEPEHEALAHVCGWGLTDLFREHEEGDGLFTWWDYRSLAFPRNAGLRIDLVLGSPAASGRCQGVVIERDERKGPKPSDHCPVTAYLDE